VGTSLARFFTIHAIDRRTDRHFAHG